MLKRPFSIVLGVTLGILLPLSLTIAVADSVSTCGATVGLRGGKNPIIESALCVSTESGATDSVAADGPAPASEEPVCRRSDGSVLPCWQGNYSWNYYQQLYCTLDTLQADTHIWNTHRDKNGDTNGALYLCRAETTPDYLGIHVWMEHAPDTPSREGYDRETLEQTALASIELHPPTAGVGAYIYPEHAEYGLIWIVGAPLWLWVDTTDDRQWGTHTSVIELEGTTLTTTATASHTTYTTGDDSEPTICHNPGTPRPWNPNSPLNQQSPTCEHTYLTTSELGNTESHYTVTATVTWTIQWHTNNGQSGATTLDLTSTNNPHIHISELRIVTYNNPQPHPT